VLASGALADEQHVPTTDPNENHAREAGLVYVSDEMPGILRRRAGKGFVYVDPRGGRVRDPSVVQRIRSLAIPPAYTSVWICPRPDGHIQATARDERGRKQYRYHPEWRAIRDANKFDRMLAFARRLPDIRVRIEEELRRPGLSRAKVLAVVVGLLDRTLIRVGNTEYARSNDSYGLTTLRDDHLDVTGGEMRFQFRGKSGKDWQLRYRDRRFARVLKSMQDLPGQTLFQYVDEEGVSRPIESTDVNGYLRHISGEDVSSKDFRTWGGTVLAAQELVAVGPFGSQKQAKSHIRQAIARVASRLGNTVAVCRKCYVHPDIVASYLEADLPPFDLLPVDAAKLDDRALREHWEALVRAHLERRATRSGD
jgi:DNA topoisomerase-1